MVFFSFGFLWFSSGFLRVFFCFLRVFFGFSYSFKLKKTKENYKKTIRKQKKTIRKPKKTKENCKKRQGAAQLATLMFFWPCALVKRLHQRCFVFSLGLVFWSRIHAALDFGSWASPVPDPVR